MKADPETLIEAVDDLKTALRRFVGLEQWPAVFLLLAFCIGLVTLLAY